MVTIVVGTPTSVKLWQTHGKCWERVFFNVFFLATWYIVLALSVWGSGIFFLKFWLSSELDPETLFLYSGYAKIPNCQDSPKFSKPPWCCELFKPWGALGPRDGNFEPWARGNGHMPSCWGPVSWWGKNWNTSKHTARFLKNTALKPGHGGLQGSVFSPSFHRARDFFFEPFLVSNCHYVKCSTAVL